MMLRAQNSSASNMLLSFGPGGLLGGLSTKLLPGHLTT